MNGGRGCRGPGRSNLPQKSSTVPSGSLDLACVASVSVRFRSKEQGTRVKDRTKMGQVKAFFGSHFISRAAKTGLSLPRNQMETLATQASLDPNQKLNQKFLDPSLLLHWISWLQLLPIPRP